MKTLGLLRHAKSDWDDLALRDFDRGLNARGQRGAAIIGAHIREGGQRWDRAVASPAARVRATLEATGLNLAPEFDRRLYLADGATLMGVLCALPGDPRSVLLVGHNPGLHELVIDLVAEDAQTPLFDAASAKFPTASYAVLELDIDSWAELGPGCGRLTHFVRPRDLDPALGPQRHF